MYAKVFTSIWSSSLVQQREGKWVFIAMLTMADMEGQVEDRAEVIAARINEPVEFVLKGIQQLEQPDPDSKSSEEDGRRIVRLRENQNWGWRIVNYLKYRGLRDEDARRLQNRDAKARQRDRERQPESATVSQSQPRSAHVEVEVDTEAEVLSPPTPSPQDPSLSLGLEGQSDPKPARKRKPRIGSDTLRRETGALKSFWNETYERSTHQKYVEQTGDFTLLSKALGPLGYEEACKTVRRFLFTDNKFRPNDKSIRRFHRELNEIRASMAEEPDDWCVR